MCVYRSVYIISHLGCVCVYPDLGDSPCHAFRNLPGGCSTEQLLSLLKGSPSSSAPFPLKTRLSVSACLSFHVQCHSLVHAHVLYLYLFPKEVWRPPGWTSQTSLWYTNQPGHKHVLPFSTLCKQTTLSLSYEHSLASQIQWVLYLFELTLSRS